jgi:hypothetical protein
MAIVRLKKLIEDLASGAQAVVADSAPYATSAGNAGTAAIAGTAAKATSAGISGTANYAGTAAVAAKGTSGSAL